MSAYADYRAAVERLSDGWGADLASHHYPTRTLQERARPARISPASTSVRDDRLDWFVLAIAKGEGWKTPARELEMWALAEDLVWRDGPSLVLTRAGRARVVRLVPERRPVF